jgi:hypothetical protein
VAAPVGAPNGEVIISYHVPQVATQTMLSPWANPSVADAQVTYTATVSPISGTGTHADARRAEVASWSDGDRPRGRSTCAAQPG